LILLPAVSAPVVSAELRTTPTTSGFPVYVAPACITVRKSSTGWLKYQEQPITNNNGSTSNEGFYLSSV
jgi:hypothetical protein